MVSALLRKNLSRQPLLPRNAKRYENDDENNNNELRVLVHVDRPEMGWVPESQRLKQRRRNVVDEEVLSSIVKCVVLYAIMTMETTATTIRKHSRFEQICGARPVDF